MMLFRRGNRKKSNHRTPLIWRPQEPDQGGKVDVRFADVAAIQERVTAVLRSIPQETFADSFQKLYERCQ
jgi:hypothetical protein